MSTTTTSLSSCYRFENLSLGKRSLSSLHNTSSLPWNPTAKHGYAISTQTYGINRQRRTHHTIKMDLNAVDLSGVSVPSGFQFPDWSNWFLVVIPVVIVPLITTGKWGPFLELKNKLSKALDQVDNAAEAIEDVARKVDKIADGITENMPEGKLRSMIQQLDDVAEQTIKAADCVEDILEKVDDVEEKIDEMIKESAAKEKAKGGVSATKVVEGH
ncbi:hypothetical protein ACHQM5_023460 [Ranunculus cassubicifolius]